MFVRFLPDVCIFVVFLKYYYLFEIMQLKFQLLIFLLCGGILLQNCNIDDCDFGPVDEFFDIQNLDLEAFKTDENLNCCAPLVLGDTIPFADFRHIEMIFEVDFVADNTPAFSFFNALYACSPVLPGDAGSKEEAFTDISVVTLRDFDAVHPAGSDISDYFSISEFRGVPPKSIDAFLEGESGRNVQLPSYILTLDSFPQTDRTLKFEVTVALSNGEFYVAENTPFTVTE